VSVHLALTAGEPPLGPVLAVLAESADLAATVADLLSWDVDRLTGAWYRHCSALLAGAGRVPGVAVQNAQHLTGFATELLDIRRQLLTTNSANQRLLYERLAVRWRSAVGRG
jgi:hypothetical protein